MSKLEKKRGLLRGLGSEFHEMAQVIRTTGWEYNESIAQLLIHESSLDDSSSRGNKAFLKTTIRERIKRPCFHCEKEGHITRNCWTNLRSRAFKSDQKAENEELSDKYQKENNTAMMVNSGTPSTNNDSPSSNKWMIYLACTKHISNNRSNFTDFETKWGAVLVVN